MTRRHHLARSATALTVVAAVAFGATGCFAGDAPASTSTEDGGAIAIRLAVNNTTSSLAAVVADQEGFFDDHGLDVTSEVVADIGKIPAALGNQFDLGFGVAPLTIRAAGQGLDIVVASGNGVSRTDRRHVAVVAAPGSDIAGPEDLAGLRLAGPTLTGTLHLGTLQWLQDAGVDASDVEAVQVNTPVMIDQIEQGVIDAAEVQEPYLSLALDSGFVEVGDPLAAVSDPAQESVWIAARDWTDENEDAVRAFRAAIADAAAWIETNDAEAKDILAEFTGTDISLLADSTIMGFDPRVHPSDLEAWATVMRNVSDFTDEINAEELIAYPGE